MFADRIQRPIEHDAHSFCAFCETTIWRVERGREKTKKTCQISFATINANNNNYIKSSENKKNQNMKKK